MQCDATDGLKQCGMRVCMRVIGRERERDLQKSFFILKKKTI